jgi:phosphinothricin acetyltransferase
VITIRDAREEDLEAVRQIYAPYVLHGLATFEEVPPDLEELGRRRTSILACGFPYLVAEADGEVVGYAYASAYRARPAYRYTAEDSVYVAERRRGQGVGRLLLTQLIARCEASPCRQMVAIIGDSANSASVRLHSALGFRLAGTLQSVGFKLGRWVDTVLMQREIGPGSTVPPDGR